MKRLYVTLSIAVLFMVGGLAFGTSSAQASVPQFSFKTEDGKWDGEIGNEYKGSNISIELTPPIYLKTSSESKRLKDYSKLKVRLVNARTGKSTDYHSLKSGKATFKNMKAGKFYVDVKDGYPSAKVSGKLQIVFLN